MLVGEKMRRECGDDVLRARILVDVAAHPEVCKVLDLLVVGDCAAEDNEGAVLIDLADGAYAARRPSRPAGEGPERSGRSAGRYFEREKAVQRRCAHSWPGGPQLSIAVLNRSRTNSVSSATTTVFTTMVLGTAILTVYRRLSRFTLGFVALFVPIPI